MELWVEQAVADLSQESSLEKDWHPANPRQQW
jgi:hypothetical protein